MDIGYATATDKAGWWPLWQAYLEFYNHPLPDEISDLTFGRCLDWPGTRGNAERRH